jgi:Zn-dependent protease with chaperone function
MSVGAQRFTTKARTWLFIAALTALLVGIGALIGGMFLYFFVVLAVGLNVVGYWFSDRLVLKASRAKPVEPGTNPELEAMVQELAQRGSPYPGSTRSLRSSRTRSRPVATRAMRRSP